METKHTNPPWEAHIGDTHIIITAQGDIICSVQRKTCSRLEAEQDANAHLMVAAPELLGALKHLLDQFKKWEGYHDWTEEDEVAAERADAAIAKAQPPTTGKE